MSARWLNRCILWLSLAGMILVTHLWVQQARGFDQGCLGLGSATPAVLYEGGCADETLQAAGRIFGISPAAWGYAFYFGLALVSFFKLLTPPRFACALHLMGEAAALFALLYTGYLLYVMAFVAGTFCLLCLGSALLIALLFVAHLMLRLKGGFSPPEGNERLVEWGMAGGSLFAAFGLMIGVLLFVNRLGTRPLDQGSTAEEIQRMVGRSLPRYIDAGHLAAMRACRLEPSERPLDLEELIPSPMSYRGAEDGIPVVLFFDPDCGHCTRYFHDLQPLIESHGDRARFFIVPHRLWASSEMQVNALLLASRDDLYFDLWRRMLDLRNREGEALEVETIAAVFRDLGLDAENLGDRLLDLRPTARERNASNRAAGVRGTPTIFVDGLRVPAYNQSVACLETLIERRLRLRELQARRNPSDSPPSIDDD